MQVLYTKEEEFVPCGYGFADGVTSLYLRDTRADLAVATPSVEICNLTVDRTIGYGLYAVAATCTVTLYGEFLEKFRPLRSFNDPEYVLLELVDFDVEREKGIIYLSNDHLGIYGSGITLNEAQRDCEAMLISLYRRYAEDDGPKSEAATAFGERLKLFVRRRGNNE